MSDLQSSPILPIFYYLTLGLFKQQNVSNKILILPFRSVLAHCLKPVEDKLCNRTPPMPSESMEFCNYINLRMCSLCRIRALEVSFENTAHYQKCFCRCNVMVKYCVKPTCIRYPVASSFFPWSVSCAGASELDPRNV